MTLHPNDSAQRSDQKVQAASQPFAAEVKQLSQAIDQALRGRAGSAAFVSAVLIGLSGSLQAATLTVDTNLDNIAVDGNCTLREAIADMNAGVASADCPVSGGAFGMTDEILFDPALSGSTITLNGSQLPTIGQALSITGPVEDDPNSITIDGNGLSRILDIQGAVPSEFAVELNNMTLTGGQTIADSESGGAVYAYAVELGLSNTVVTGNSTTGSAASGGGLHIFNGDVSLTDSTLSENSTAGDFARGGGLYVYGSATLVNSSVSGNSTEGLNAEGGGLAIYFDNLTLTDSTVTGNSTLGERADGGGLSVYGGNATLTDSTVSANSTAGEDADGGGLAVYGDASLIDSIVSDNSTAADDSTGGGIHVRYGNANLSSSTVSGNSSAGEQASGGGLAVENGNASLTDSQVSSNTTSGDGAGGGGLWVYGDLNLVGSVVSDNSTAGENASGGGAEVYRGSASLTNSTVSGNTTTARLSRGGGVSVAVGYSDDATVVLDGSTLSGNVTEGDSAQGGGLYVFLADTVLINSAVSGNSVLGDMGQGGGLSIAADASLIHSSIVDNNFEADAFAVHIDPGSTFTLDNSLIVQSGAADVACNQAAVGSNSLATDPSCGTAVDSSANINLGPLANNGGFTQTHALNAGSAAIDGAPNDDLCMNAPPAGAGGVDQRGIPRPNPLGGLCDIGAYESDGTQLPEATAVPTLSLLGLLLLPVLILIVGWRRLPNARRNGSI